MNTAVEDEVVSEVWDADAAALDATPTDQKQIDKEFTKIVSPYMASSGWVCTLTQECGTFGLLLQLTISTYEGGGTLVVSPPRKTPTSK